MAGRNENCHVIDGVEATSDTLTSRGGLALFVRYLRNIAIYPVLERLFGSIRKSAKGQPVSEIFKQVFCFLVDGTSRHLVYFDALKEDEGYAAALETAPERMLSSHAVKRFFNAFSWFRIWLFRVLLKHLFLWRLKIRKPEVIILGLDTMVMAIVRFIRQHYGEEVPIIMRLDAGFFDQELFQGCEELKIGYICGGRVYQELQTLAENAEAGQWRQYRNQQQVWDYLELGDRRGTWKTFRRAVLCRPVTEGRQRLLDYVRPLSIFYTNLGMGQPIDQHLTAVGRQHYLEAAGLIAGYHGRGADELVHRGLKDFGFEELPFLRFAPNAALYYTMVVAFFLFACFKEDVCGEVTPVEAYATTLRRRLIDVAAKIVRHAGQTILKVAATAMEQLQFAALWVRSGAPPRFAWA
jgi:Transposase DDE domain group 1